MADARAQYNELVSIWDNPDKFNAWLSGQGITYHPQGMDEYGYTPEWYSRITGYQTQGVVNDEGGISYIQAPQYESVSDPKQGLMQQINNLAPQVGEYQFKYTDKNSSVNKVAAQISGQRSNLGTRKNYGGDAINYYGEAGLDKMMAEDLVSRGITDISQITQKEVPNIVPSGDYDWYGEPMYVEQGTKKVAWNSVTNEPLARMGYQHAWAGSGNVWSGTYGGDDSTTFNIDFSPDGLPIFTTGFGGSSSDFDVADIAPIVGIGLMLVPGIGQAVGSFVLEGLSTGLAASAGSAITSAVGNAVIQSALTGSVKQGVTSAAASYFGGAIGGELGKVAGELFDSPAGAEFIQKLGSAGTRAAILGQDVGQAMANAAVGASFNLVANSIPGYSEIKDPGTKQAINNAVTTALTGQGSISVNIQNAMLAGATSYALSQVEVDGKKFKDLPANQQTIVSNLVSGAIQGKPLDQTALSTAISLGNQEMNRAFRSERSTETPKSVVTESPPSISGATPNETVSQGSDSNQTGGNDQQATAETPQPTVIEGQNGEQIELNNQGEVVSISSPEGDILADVTSPTFDADAASQIIQDAGITAPVEFAGPKLEDLTSPEELNIDNLKAILGPQVGPTRGVAPADVDRSLIYDQPVDTSGVVTPTDLFPGTQLPIDTDLTSFVTNAAQEAGFDEKETADLVKDAVPEITRETVTQEVTEPVEPPKYSEPDMQAVLQELGEVPPAITREVYGPKPEESEAVSPLFFEQLQPISLDEFAGLTAPGQEIYGPQLPREPVVTVGQEPEPAPVIDRDVISPSLDLNSVADAAKEAGYSESDMQDLLQDLGQGATVPGQDLTVDQSGVTDVQPVDTLVGGLGNDILPVDNLGTTDLNQLVTDAAYEAGYTDDDVADLTGDLTFDEITLGDLIKEDTLFGGEATVPANEEFRIDASGGTPMDTEQGQAEAGTGLGTEIGVSDYDTLQGGDTLLDLSDQPVGGPQSGGGAEEEPEPTNQGQAEEGAGLGSTVGEGPGADLNQPDAGWPDWLKGFFRNLISTGTPANQARNFANQFLGSGTQTGTGIQSPGMLGPTYQPWYSQMPEFDITKAFSPTLYAMREEEPDVQAEEE